MRTPLLAALACLVLSGPRGSTAVDACGFPPPEVLLVSSHQLAGPDHGSRSRTFAVLGEPVPSELTWRLLAPGTYDGTRIADAPALESARTLTLLGPAGTRVVTARRRAFLAAPWKFTSSAALELDGSTAQVALAGADPHAAWIELEDVRASAADVAWATEHGGSDDLYITRVPGTTVETVSTSAPGRALTVIRRGDRETGRVDGRPIGAMTSRVGRFLLVEHAGVVTPIRI